MNKHFKLMAVLSTAGVMTVVTPYIAASLPDSASVALAATNGWVEEDGEIRYLDSDGYYLTDSWKKKDGDWYYFDEKGYVSKYMAIDEYYVGETGKRVYNQWVTVPNEDDWDVDSPENYLMYYSKNGQAVISQWHSIDGKLYYFNEDGYMQTGKMELDGATYYLGEETNGAMQKGWIQLEDDSDIYEEDNVWHFFDNDGKMVMNQVDRKIDNEYYTFENGILQTGWYKLPIDPEDATASNAAAAKPEIASYKYYEADGKRANGWHEIEGVEHINDDSELFHFYFKNGSPYYAETGIQTFTIDGKKYGINTRGEMQTYLQTVTLEDGTTANFYFGEDGVIATGKQMIYSDALGEDQTWLFDTSGGSKGQGFHGIRNNNVYHQGLRLDADRDMKLAPVDLDGILYLVNANGAIQKASSASTSTTKPELEKGFRDYTDANDKVWTVDTEGVVQQ
ncbi:MAG: N-acetylmuramoyl-L-alanine amidase family protein [Lachnospiraceae bacterium]